VRYDLQPGLPIAALVVVLSVLKKKKAVLLAIAFYTFTSSREPY
jgi:hypothetical protein